MLKLVIYGHDSEEFNNKTQEFIQTKATFKEQTLILEHSLISLSKWESIYHKPFLDDSAKKTKEETKEYIKCMTLTQNVDESVYDNFTDDDYKKINDYIQDPMTATWFTKEQTAGVPTIHRSSEKITSELIYYWMIACEIPPQYEKWHLNRLLTLIRICNIKNKQPKKMGKKDILSKNAALNAARRKSYGSKG